MRSSKIVGVVASAFLALGVGAGLRGAWATPAGTERDTHSVETQSSTGALDHQTTTATRQAGQDLVEIPSGDTTSRTATDQWNDASTTVSGPEGSASTWSSQEVHVSGSDGRGSVTGSTAHGVDARGNGLPVAGVTDTLPAVPNPQAHVEVSVGVSAGL